MQVEDHEKSSIRSSKIIPQEVVGPPYVGRRRYTKRQRLSDLAECRYQETGKGITFQDIMNSNMAKHKMQAQLILKHGLKSNVLFTLGKRRPQKYYPVSLKSEIMKCYLSNNIPKGITGLSSITADFISGADAVILNSLTNYVLPLLPAAPLFIHNLRLKIRLSRQSYNEILIQSQRENKSKEFEEIIGKNRINYLIYPNGTVVVSTKNSNNPLRLNSELDRSRIFAFFGQVRDRLIHIVTDIHERLVPEIMQWELTQCDINKDIPVSHWLQMTGLKIQISHLDHLFRIYIKSMGKDTVCRIEDCKSTPNKPAIENINEIFNPNERTNELLIRVIQELSELKSIITGPNHSGVLVK